MVGKPHQLRAPRDSDWEPGADSRDLEQVVAERRILARPQFAYDAGQGRFLPGRSLLGREPVVQVS